MASSFSPEPGELRETLYSAASRYYGIEVLKTKLANGREVAYLERRFLPPHEVLETIGKHTVQHGDRIDNVAANYFGDPELYWRLCDGNFELDPEKLTAVAAQKINITLPPRNDRGSDV